MVDEKKTIQIENEIFERIWQQKFQGTGSLYTAQKLVKRRNKVCIDLKYPKIARQSQGKLEVGL